MSTFWPPRLSNAPSSHGTATAWAGLSSAASHGAPAGAFPSVTTVTSVPPSWIRAFRPSSSEQVVMNVCERRGPPACSALSWVSRTAWVSRSGSELRADTRGCMGASKSTCWSSASRFCGLSRTTLALPSPGTTCSWLSVADTMSFSGGSQYGAAWLAGTGGGAGRRSPF